MIIDRCVSPKPSCVVSWTDLVDAVVPSSNLLSQAPPLPSSDLVERTLVIRLLSGSFVQNLLTERIDASIGLNLVVSLCQIRNIFGLPVSE